MNLNVLLDESFETYYWLGFLLADGCVVGNRIKLCLSEKDSEHIHKLCKYIDYGNTISLEIKPKGHRLVRIGFGNKDWTPLFCDKWDFRERKTYNPPKVSVYDRLYDRQILSLLIGYIDGDGCIVKQTGRHDVRIDIHIHSSWIEFLTYISDRISTMYDIKFNKPHLLNSGYIRWSISNRLIVNALLEEAKKQGLPILDRKWNKINTSLEIKRRKKSNPDVQKMALDK